MFIKGKGLKVDKYLKKYFDNQSEHISLVFCIYNQVIAQQFQFQIMTKNEEANGNKYSSQWLTFFWPSFDYFKFCNLSTSWNEKDFMNISPKPDK